MVLSAKNTNVARVTGVEYAILESGAGKASYQINIHLFFFLILYRSPLQSIISAILLCWVFS